MSGPELAEAAGFKSQVEDIVNKIYNAAALMGTSERSLDDDCDTEILRCVRMAGEICHDVIEDLDELVRQDAQREVSARRPTAIAKLESGQPKTLLHQLEEVVGIELSGGLDALQAIVDAAFDPDNDLEVQREGAVLDCVRLRLQNAKDRADMLLLKLSRIVKDAKAVLA